MYTSKQRWMRTHSTHSNLPNALCVDRIRVPPSDIQSKWNSSRNFQHFSRTLDRNIKKIPCSDQPQLRFTQIVEHKSILKKEQQNCNERDRRRILYPLFQPLLRKVHFDSCIHVILVPSRRDFSDELIDKIWWSSEDVQDFRDKACEYFKQGGQENIKTLWDLSGSIESDSISLTSIVNPEKATMTSFNDELTDSKFENESEITVEECCCTTSNFDGKGESILHQINCHTLHEKLESHVFVTDEDVEDCETVVDAEQCCFPDSIVSSILHDGENLSDKKAEMSVGEKNKALSFNDSVAYSLTMNFSADAADKICSKLSVSV